MTVKRVSCIVLLITTFIISQEASGSMVTIKNMTLAKLGVSLDIIGYPDPVKIINKNSDITIDIGNFFMRGINVGIYLGDYYFDNIMSESLSQTLGLGDITYYIFMKTENLGRTNIYGEYIFGLTFYLMRCPKFLYSGGIMHQSAVIKVKTSDLNTLYPVIASDNSSGMVCTVRR